MEITLNDNGLLIKIEIPKDKEAGVRSFILRSLLQLQEGASESVREAHRILKEQQEHLDV